ncbi:MAG: sensor histidine kinase, partial [Planctomycetota bacterium]
VCLLIGAVGVIWLGWCWRRLARGITSIARQLKQDYPNAIKLGENATLDGLRQAVNERLAAHAGRDVPLKEQVQDLQIQIQLAQRQKRNAEAIIYSIRDAVLVVDESDKLLMANEAAGQLFGFDFRSSKRKSIGELIDPTKSEFVDFLRQSRQGRVRHTKREIGFSKEAQHRTFDCIVSCVRDDKDQISGVVAVLHDITREKEISQMKNDFVSHVSHELKTPLASITAYSEMLADGEAEDEETRKEFYSVIQSQAQRLNRLIEDILNVSRIESGMVKVDKKPVSLTILIEEQLPMIKGYAEEKSIEVVSQKPIVFDQVYADKDMLSQVIVNLLSNAVKYTPAGGSVTIETEVDETAGIARVTVADTGVGIPEEEVEHVFDKFYRVGANKNQAKGTGLGLNLVKQIVEKVHAGRVFVTSKQGQGSTFGFEVPLAKQKVSQPA